MKYLLLLLFLIGCTHAQPQPKPVFHSYTCSSFMVHGSFAKWEGDYENIEKAVLDAETINQRLIDSGEIPDSCVPMCTEIGGEGISVMVGTSHRFKPGDCIKSKDGFEGVVHEVWGKDYAVLIGLECTAKNWTSCSRSAYPIDTVDKNFEKIECPK